MKVQAYVLRTHNNQGSDPVEVEKGSVIPLPTSQFNDLKGVGLVREATDKEIAAAKGDAGK